MAAARAIARGEVDRAVNFFGGLHHAMADHASGFGVYNDAALAIAALLRAVVRRVVVGRGKWQVLVDLSGMFWSIYLAVRRVWRQHFMNDELVVARVFEKHAI